MDRTQENRLRADYVRYYQLEQVNKQVQNPVGKSLPTPVTRAVRGIAAKYERLPASDDRRETWRHLVAISREWEQQPEEMYELLDDLEHHHAAGKPLISETHLRNHQQVRHLYTARTRTQTPQQQPPQQTRQPITRSR